MASYKYVVEKVGSSGSVVSTTVGTTDLSKAEFEKGLGEGQSVIGWAALGEAAPEPTPATPAKGTAAKRGKS